jgi:hypothetical protein
MENKGNVLFRFYSYTVVVNPFIACHVPNDEIPNILSLSFKL